MVSFITFVAIKRESLGLPLLWQVALAVKVGRPSTCRTTCALRRLSNQKYYRKYDSTASYTLQTRILKYFKELDELKSQVKVNTCMESNVLRTIEPISSKIQTNLSSDVHANVANKIHLIKSISKLGNESNLSKTRFDTLLTSIDDKCCKQLHQMTRKEVLMLLNSWMNFVPHKMTNLQFYRLVLPKMKDWLLDNALPVGDFAQIMFYCGLLKKSLYAKEIMKLSLKVIDQNIDVITVPIEELCIIGNAIFKTGTKITSPKLLSSINNVMDDNIDYLLKDPALLITLVKVLRHAQSYNYNLIEKFSTKILSDQQSMHILGFAAKAHILAWFAGASFVNPDLLSCFIRSSKIDLENQLQSMEISVGVPIDHFSVKIRAKDISRFLWAVSHLNCTLEFEFVDTLIIPELVKKLSGGEYNEQPIEMVDSLLSLWILGFNPDKLFIDALSSNMLETLRHQNKIRFNSRLALLITCASIEAPNVLREDQLLWRKSIYSLKEPNIGKLLSKRPLLTKVFNVITCLASKLKISSISFSFAVPHLHIAGIVAITPFQPIYIEVIDSTVCLYKSETLTGLMQLKLRLLKSLKGRTVIVESYALEGMTDSAILFEYIEDKLTAALRWK